MWIGIWGLFGCHARRLIQYRFGLERNRLDDKRGTSISVCCCFCGRLPVRVKGRMHGAFYIRTFNPHGPHSYESDRSACRTLRSKHTRLPFTKIHRGPIDRFHMILPPTQSWTIPIRSRSASADPGYFINSAARPLEGSRRREGLLLLSSSRGLFEASWFVCDRLGACARCAACMCTSHATPCTTNPSFRSRSIPQVRPFGLCGRGRRTPLARFAFFWPAR